APRRAASSPRCRRSKSMGKPGGRSPVPAPSIPVPESFPYLGHGIGLRTTHFPRVLDGTAHADWFEASSENFMIRGGRAFAVLERGRAEAPRVVPGVALSIGST